jgi:hypothetical protein
MSTTNLGLETFNVVPDGNTGYLDLRKELGDTTNSNMTKIDIWGYNTMLLMSAIGSAITASLVPANSFITNSSGSISSITGSLTSASAKITKIGTYNGTSTPGQADFNTISGSYTHLILIGMATVNTSGSYADIGCDINGITTSGSYESLSWYRSGSSYPYLEVMSGCANSQIYLAKATGNDVPPPEDPADQGYATPFMAIFPNYSGSAGLYKTGMGISAFVAGSCLGIGYRGGFFKSVSPITRIRVFGSFSGSTRINFSVGTYMNLYGI